MRTIYIDADYKCHVSDDGTMTAVETDAFDGKCDAYIEGYRFIPSGKVWTRLDGTDFLGAMITPWKSYSELDSYQRQYEQDQLAQLQEENAVLIEESHKKIEELLQQTEAFDNAYIEGVNSV